MPAVWRQSTYFLSIELVSAAPGPYSPIQSFGVGLLILLQVTFTLPPRPTLFGLASRFAVPVRVAVLVAWPALVAEATAVLVAVELD